MDNHGPPITEEKLLAANTKVGNSKAVSFDGILSITLKTAIKAAPGMFLDMYNSCLNEEMFSEKWKWQRLVFLPKGRKHPENPSSYHAPYMLDTIDEIFERILYNRIEEVVRKSILDCQ